MPMKNLNIPNPVDVTLQFLSAVEDEQPKGKPATEDNITTQRAIPIQDRPKTDKNGRELKRKRFNLLLLPSLFEDIKKIAYFEKSTLNETVNRALELYRDTKRDILAKYAEIEKLKASNGPKNQTS
jgi:hypothetical protein